MRRMRRGEEWSRAQFDEAMAIFRDGYLSAYPGRPFIVDGVVTPQAMEYIRGYCAGLRSLREELGDGPKAG